MRQRSIEKVVYRVALAATLGSTLRHAATLLWVVGVLTLLTRLRHDFQPEIFGLLLLAPLTGLLFARGRFIDKRVAAAWLDKMAGGTGTIVTAFERGAAADAPNVTPRMRLGKAALWTLPAIAFVAIALFVPISQPDEPPSPTEHAVENLEEQLETLDEVAELDEDKLEELQENLEDLHSSEDTPTEAAFEAIDSMEEELQRLAEELADSSERAQEAMQEAQEAQAPEEAKEKMAEALQQLSESGLTKELSEALEEALGEEAAQQLQQALESGDPEALQQAMEGMSPEQMGQMAEALTEALQSKMEQLASSGLIEPGQGQPQECSISDAQAGHCVPGEGDGAPGKGGPSPGGGGADLTWGEEPPNHDELFQSELLQASEIPDLANSELIGEQYTAPEADARAQAGGDADVAQSFGEAAWDRDLSPRHRDAVGTFFEPDDE